jgi:hypothetical protein
MSTYITCILSFAAHRERLKKSRRKQEVRDAEKENIISHTHVFTFAHTDAQSQRLCKFFYTHIHTHTHIRAHADPRTHTCHLSHLLTHSCIAHFMCVAEGYGERACERNEQMVARIGEMDGNMWLHGCRRGLCMTCEEAEQKKKADATSVLHSYILNASWQRGDSNGVWLSETLRSTRGAMADVLRSRREAYSSFVRSGPYYVFSLTIHLFRYPKDSTIPCSFDIFYNGRHLPSFRAHPVVSNLFAVVVTSEIGHTKHLT